jgi:hypothetical protein
MFYSFLPINYIYDVMMHQHATCSCGIFIITYVIAITFNIHMETLKYIITQITTHIKNNCGIIVLYHIQNNEIILLGYKKIHVHRI